MDEPSFRQSPRKFARTQRQALTRGETLLWWELRGHRLDGHAIWRQMPLGPWTADSACPTRRLVIEVDGRTHAGEERAAHDAERDAWLRRNGWRVLRFTDDEVIGGLPLVVDAIRKALRE